MKITVWIRPSADGTRSPVMRVDSKWESLDTPVIQRYGQKLMNALEGCAGNEEKGTDNELPG